MHYKLESTDGVQNSAKEYNLVGNGKLVHNIEIRLITKVVGITVRIVAISKVALFYKLQIDEYKIIFLDLDQNADHCRNLIDCSLSQDLPSQKNYEHSSTNFLSNIVKTQTNKSISKMKIFPLSRG